MPSTGDTKMNKANPAHEESPASWRTRALSGRASPGEASESLPSKHQHTAHGEYHQVMVGRERDIAGRRHMQGLVSALLAVRASLPFDAEERSGILLHLELRNSSSNSKKSSNLLGSRPALFNRRF